jgi:hypothetical protein
MLNALAEQPQSVAVRRTLGCGMALIGFSSLIGRCEGCTDASAAWYAAGHGVTHGIPSPESADDIVILRLARAMEESVYAFFRFDLLNDLRYQSGICHLPDPSRSYLRSSNN